MSDIVSKGGNVSREQVWLSAWLAVARAESCLKPDVPATWADGCLKAFDRQFGRPREYEPSKEKREQATDPT